MPRTRPPNLREWSPLQNHCTLLIPRTRAFLPPAINNHLPGKPNNESLAHPRLLHSTPSRSAARPAPSTRRKVIHVRDTGRSGALGQQPPKSRPQDSSLPNTVADAGLQAQMQNLEKNAFELASAMLRDGIVDKTITPKKIKRIGEMLLWNAYTSRAVSPDAIHNIARSENVDVETIFDIGRMITREDHKSARWVMFSCLHAGSRMALLIFAARSLRVCHDSDSVYNATAIRDAPPDPIISRIAVIVQSNSERDRYDLRARLIYAKYLGLRGQYEQGITLVQEVLQLIEPTRLPPKPNESLTISSLIEPPWQLLAWLKRELRNSQIKKRKNRGDKKGKTNDVLPQDEVDALRLGAIEYQDPIALLHYARYMGEESGIQEYETYMGQAAAAGDKDACRKLANFYYLISVGKYPQLGTRNAKSTKLQGTTEATMENIDSKEAKNSKGVLSTILSYFGPRPLHEYRALAMEWYRVGLAQGCPSSALNLSLLYGQDGDHEAAKAVVQEFKEHVDVSKIRETAEKLMAAPREGTNVPMGLHLDV